MSTLFHILLNGLGVYAAVAIVNILAPGVKPVHIASYQIAIFVSLVISLMNRTVRPILKIITLPINILTLGLFGFIINGIIISLVPSVVDWVQVGGFVIHGGFWWAIALSMLISFVQSTLHVLVK
jgi:putative membrane protein